MSRGTSGVTAARPGGPERLPEESVHLTGESLELASSVWYHGGSNDRSVDRLDILEIEDPAGGRHQPVWSATPHQLLPGVETFRTDGTNRVRIERRACPLRVRFRASYEYDSYTDSEHCSSYHREYWVTYRSDPPAEPPKP